MSRSLSQRGTLQTPPERYTYAPTANPVEMVPFVGFGHSYVQGVGVIPGTAFFDRVAARMRTLPYVNKGVGGTRTDQILASIEANWVPDTRGLVALMVTLNDIGLYNDTAGATTSAECFRASLAFLTSRISLPITSPSFSFGPGWTAGAASSGSYVDYAWTGDAAYIRIGAVTGAGGTVTVTNGAGGAILKTFSTGGFKQNFNAVIPLRGLGSGQHNVRIAVTSGTITLVGALIPNYSPPAIIWAKEGRFASETDAAWALQRDTYLPALSTVAAEFPAVKPVEPTGWDMTTMLGVDQVHPNDIGSMYWADRVVKAIYEFIPTPRDGVNSTFMMTNGTYVQVTPVYTAPGATVPAQVTGVTATTAQAIDVAWTAPTDGGSTITGYRVQYRVVGQSTWDGITVGGSARSVTLAAGILGGTSYEIQVAAINAIGTGAYSATVTQTSGIIPYAVDNFDRANSASLGSTPTGNYAWTQTATNFSIYNNALSVASTGSAKDVIDEPHINGTLEMTLLTYTSGLVGLSFRGTPGQAGEYVFYAGEGTAGYALKKRTATDSFTTLATATPNTPVVNGAVLTVVLNGSSIICKVNGVTVITATDSSYTGTEKGFFARLAVATIDNFKYTP